MAHTKVTKTYSQNTGTANTFSYSGSFDVFKGTEVVALLDNVLLTYTASTINESASPREYTVDTSAKTIHIGGANLSSGTIIIRPETDMGAPTPRADYTPGASITSADLNNNQLQLMRKAMEYDEQKLSSTGGTMTGDLTMGEDTKIVFEGATDDAYETTLTVTDPTADRTITIPNVSGNVVTTGDTATVTATMMAANSVDSSELVDGSIDSSHIANDQVNSQHYAAGSIDHEHLANDIIDGDNIQDDVINSEHIAAGAIDLEHMSSASVDSDNIVNDTIVNADINSSAAIAGTKISPNFGSQTVVSTGNFRAAADDSAFKVGAGDDLILTHSGSAGLLRNDTGDLKVRSASLTVKNQADDETLLTATDGGSVDLYHNNSKKFETTAAGATVTGTLTADLADNSIDSEHYVDGSIDAAHIGNDQIDSQHYVAASIDNEHLADDAVGADELASNAVVDASVASGAAIAHSKLAAVSSGNIIVGNGSNVPTSVAMSGDVAIAAGGATTIQANSVEIGMIGCEQTTISDSDSHIPTSGAVVDYVAAVVGPIGGLEVIADDESFPNTIPAAGVVISITDCAGLSVNSSGVSTNGDALDNSTITINGFPSELRGGVGGNADPYVFASGAGLMVVSTGSSHTYNYHQALIREADFVQLSDDISDFNSRYRIGTKTADNHSSNDDGDLFFDTGANKMYVYDGAYNSGGSWKEVTSAGDFKFLGIKTNGQAYNGSLTFDGSADQFDLFDGSSDASITSAAQLIVVLNGVVQKPNSSYDADGEGFALDGSDGIRFCDPPPSGSVCFVTQIGSAVALNEPADDTVSAAKIQSGAVSGAKLSSDLVYTSDMTWDSATNAGRDMKWDESESDLTFNDAAYIQMGDANDLSIGHNGTSSFIQNTSSKLTIGSGGNYTTELLYGNAKKFETTADGAQVTGKLFADNGFWCKDSDVYRCGDDTDMMIYHDGISKMVDTSGNLHIGTNSFALKRQGLDETMLTGTANGAVELYYDHAKKFETKSDGVDITGELQCDSLDVDGAADFTGADVTFYGANYNTYWDQSESRFTFEDNAIAAFGSSADLYLEHDGSHSYINHNGQGDLFVQTDGLFAVQKYGTTERLINANADGAVELFHDGNLNFYTQPAGVRIENNNTQDTELRIFGGSSDRAAILTLTADNGAAHDDNFRVQVDYNHHFAFYAKPSGTWTERFRMITDGTLTATDTTIGSLSDSRLKKNSADFTYDLAKFKQFKPKTYEWINVPEHQSGVHRGFLAQDIESVDSHLVADYRINDDSPDKSLVGSDQIAKQAKLGTNDAMYISVIQQLMAKIETLETKVAALEAG